MSQSNAEQHRRSWEIRWIFYTADQNQYDESVWEFAIFGLL